jgi:hypothetical protein
LLPAGRRCPKNPGNALPAGLAIVVVVGGVAFGGFSHGRILVTLTRPPQARAQGASPERSGNLWQLPLRHRANKLPMTFVQSRLC